jgi:hypothetical protein
MSIFRPKSTQSSGGSKFLGVQSVGILEFRDESDKWDWADIYLSVTLKVEGSEYERVMKVAGSLDRDGSGNITGGSVLNRLYNLFDTIGCHAGINLKGEWEHEEEGSIEIEDYLNQNHVHVGSFPDDDPKFEYLAYLYKKQPKRPGSKAYTEVWPKLALNTAAGRKSLTSDMNYLRKKGYLKEVTEDTVSTNGTATPTPKAQAETTGVEVL